MRGARIVVFKKGLAINGDFPSDVATLINSYLRRVAKPISLVVADPPYGMIVKQAWDKVGCDEEVQLQLAQLGAVSSLVEDGSAVYWFGGVGKPGYRLFYKLASRVEDETDLQIAMHITWGKKRAYGVRNNYLFTREEILYMVKGDTKKPTIFNVPYLDEVRGYDGYNKKYPALDARKRRTAVWTDITEILRGKLHECHKPSALLSVPISAHTNEGDVVLDLFSGSGETSVTAARMGRMFIAVERDRETFDRLVERLRNDESVSSRG